MADSTLKIVSLTSIVDFDWAAASWLNNANIATTVVLRKVLLREASRSDLGRDSDLSVYEVAIAHANQPLRLERGADEEKAKNGPSYPLTCILENARIARPAVGRPKLVAGRKVAKISMFFSSDSTSPPFSPPERTR